MKFPKLQLIIDHLKSLDNGPTSPCGFDMNCTHGAAEYTDHPCGTACCIGGHAALLLMRQGMLSCEVANIDGALALYCDIDETTAARICWPGGPENSEEHRYAGSYEEIQLPHTIAVLQRCRDTGIVDWTQTTYESPATMLEEISDKFLEMKEEARGEV